MTKDVTPGETNNYFGFEYKDYAREMDAYFREQQKEAEEQANEGERRRSWERELEKKWAGSDDARRAIIGLPHKSKAEWLKENGKRPANYEPNFPKKEYYMGAGWKPGK